MDAVREKARIRYRRKTGGRDPGVTHVKAQQAAGVLPIVIQRILPGQMEAAIQRMIDQREADYAALVREEAQAAAVKAKGKAKGKATRKRTR